MGYSGARGKLIQEKKHKQTSRDTVPLIFVSLQHAEGCCMYTSVYFLFVIRW
jgi:hypothetical protein